jgi:tripartite-type tricarboxylate transporter receptor subunit TctC
MSLTRRLLTAALVLAAPLALAQGAATFPSKPMRILVPFNAGSGSDSASRVYGDLLARLLGQPVVVENRPGGSGLLAIQATKAAPADGHTIMLASTSPMAVNPVVFKKLPYDAFADFRPIHGLTYGPAAFVARGDGPYKTIADLLAAAKAQNRPLTIGNYSDGYQLVAAWLGTLGGVTVSHVPYKGGAQMVTDVIGGSLDAGVNDFGGVAPLIKEGRLRALALTGDKRDPMFPDIPTMKESGFPDFETYVWASFYVRAETPDDIVEKLADAMRKAFAMDESKAYLAKTPGQPLMLGPKEMREFQQREYERFKRVAEAAGIKPQ